MTTNEGNTRYPEVERMKEVFVCRYVNNKSLNTPVYAVCTVETTAKRIASEENIRRGASERSFHFLQVSVETAYLIDGKWRYPGTPRYPTSEDERKQADINERERKKRYALIAREKALKLGMTEEDIKSLRNL